MADGLTVLRTSLEAMNSPDAFSSLITFKLISKLSFSYHCVSSALSTDFVGFWFAVFSLVSQSGVF